MSEFFEPPPHVPVAPEPRYRMAPWFGPPSGTLPALVPLERVLARTDDVAVCLARIAVYPAGFELEIVTMSADHSDQLEPLLFEAHRYRQGAGREHLPPELLRIGVQFADGAKATNTSTGVHHDNTTPAAPLMQRRGSGGGVGLWSETLWVWPLPPPGALLLVCEWPAGGIPLTRCELDAQLILDAAGRAEVVFSDAHLPLWPADRWSATPAEAVAPVDDEGAPPVA